mgnify:FL=1
MKGDSPLADDTLREMAEAKGILPDKATLQAGAKPDFALDQAGRYNFTWKDDGIRFIFDGMHRGNRELNCLISVRVKERPTDPDCPSEAVISRKRINLFSVSSSKEVASLISKRLNRDPQLISTMFESAAARIDDVFQSGEPMVWLPEIRVNGDRPYLAPPVLELDECTLAFAAGDSGKTWLTQALQLSLTYGVEIIPGIKPVHPVKTLFLDWETNKTTWAHRARRLLAGVNVKDETVAAIAYKRMHAPLGEAVDEIQALRDAHHFEFYAYDSGGAACGGMINDEAAVLGFFTAARLIGGTSLVTTHVPHATADRPIGSQYWESQPRATWKVIKDEEQGDSEIFISLKHAKHNNQQQQPLTSYRILFTPERVTFMRANPAERAKTESELPLTIRIENLLGDDGKLTAQEIAEMLGDVSERNVSNRLKDNEGKRFVRVGTIRPFQWAARARQEQLPSANRK